MSQFNLKEYQTVILAGLLHDIGKFLQRIKGRQFKGVHENIGADFVSAKGIFAPGPEGIASIKSIILEEWIDSALLETAIRGHHRSGKSDEYLTTIVHKADSYSTKERFEPKDNITEFVANRKFEPLKSVFSAVDLGCRGEKKVFAYSANILDSFLSFPVKEMGRLGKEESKDLFENFKSELGQLDTNDESFERFFATLYALLEKYLWCLPCHTHPQVADVSLFDHLKSTSAIAACLYQYHAQTNSLNNDAIEEDHSEKFLLLGGDLSGIQQYIYQISAITGEGGVAKRLRARSFFISALMEVTVLKILGALELPVVCNLVSAGGRFVILAPNTENTRNLLTMIEKEISQWLFETFSGELALNLDWETNLKGDDFFRKPEGTDDNLWNETERGPEEIDPERERECNYRDRFDALQDKLAQRKQRRFQSILTEDGCWNEARFILTQQYDAYAHGKSDCLSCHKFPAEHPDPHDSNESEIIFCSKCCIDKLMGRLLLNAQYLAICKTRPWDQAVTGARIPDKNAKRFYFYKDGYFIQPLTEFDPEALKSEGDDIDIITFQRLRDHHDETAPLPVGVTHRFLANYTPFFKKVEEAAPLCKKCKESLECEVRDRMNKLGADPELCTFRCIAASGCENAEEESVYRGSQLLGVLKADVDNLGLIFSEGLGNRLTVSRYLTLSRMIDLFFSGWMYRILNETPEFRYIYTVYSGGDDLVLVGPWETILLFAGRLNREFRRFTCNNPDITLSAGIATVHPKHPISNAVEQAEQQLNISKTNGKNRVALFNTCVEWKHCKRLGIIAHTLIKGQQLFKDVLTTGFLHRMLHYHSMYLATTEGRVEDLIFLSRMSYDIHRNIRQSIESKRKKQGLTEKEKKNLEWFEKRIIRELLEPLCTPPICDDLMAPLTVPVCWVLYKNRTYTTGR